MKLFRFSAQQVSTVLGFVEAESKEEALEKIKNDEYDDITDTYDEEINPNGPITVEEDNER